MIQIRIGNLVSRHFNGWLNARQELEQSKAKVAFTLATPVVLLKEGGRQLRVYWLLQPPQCIEPQICVIETAS
jgi:hypothetical protein